MAWPQTPQTLKVYIVVDGAGVDISSDVRFSSGVSITTGYSAEGTRPTPGSLSLTLNNRDGKYTPRNPESVYWNKIGRNTHIFVVVQEPSVPISYTLFYGEVTGWPSAWTPGGDDVWVTLQATGILSSLQRGIFAESRSPMTRYYESRHSNEDGTEGTLVAWWPMEDSSGALALASGLGDSEPLTLIGPTTVAAYDDWVGASTLPTLRTGGYLIGTVPAYTNTTETAIGMFLDVPAAGVSSDSRFLLLETNGTSSWALWINSSGNIAVRAYNNTAVGFAQIYDSGFNAYGVEGHRCFLRWDLVESGGSVLWYLTVYYLESAFTGYAVSISFNSSLAANTVGAVTRVRVGDSTTLDGLSPGQLGIATNSDWFDLGYPVTDYATAHDGERADDRIARLTAEAGLDGTNSSSVGSLLGPQQVDSFLNICMAAADADGGLLYEESGGGRYLAYLPRATLVNQDFYLPVTYGQDGMVIPLRSAGDDFAVVNDSTVTRINGSSARSRQLTGRLSVQEPPNGIGKYSETPTLNLWMDDQLIGTAEWRVHVGSWDEERYPQVTFDVRLAALESNSAVVALLRTIGVGNRIIIQDPPAWLPPDDIDLIVKGLSIKIDQYQHLLTLNCTPFGPYNLGVIDTDTFGNTYPLESLQTTVLHPVTSSATSFRVAVGGSGEPNATVWSTTATPYGWKVDGEEMTVTGMATNAISFLSAGTPSHGDNASLVPALPTTGTPTLGDSLFILAAIRGTAATVDTPTGYTKILDMGNVCVFQKIHTGTESAPTVSFTGGVAGDTTSACMWAMRNAQILVVNSSTQTNGSAANVAFPAINVPRSKCVVLTVAQKADDWTGVTGATGTEILDTSSTSGNDQGITAYYSIQTTATDVAAGTITVTGGAAAVSKAGVVVIAGDVQVATVTRSINGVTKSIPISTPVNESTPIRLALL